MSEFFLKVVNMSISASYLVLAVLLLRLIFKKAPKWVSVLLWGFVAIRLICPFSMESALSLIPSAQIISPEIMMDRTPEISTGIGSFDRIVNPIITESFAPQPYASANPLQILIPVFGNLWVLGILIMLAYTAISYLLLRRKVATAVRLKDNIYQSEYVDSPFVLGVCKPRIYLPFQIDAQNAEHVIAHETAHIRRKDHLWKPLGFLLLALHWFNPLMWLCYILLCRDIELACDEKVIKEMDSDAKADYTQALVCCSVDRRRIAACPLAFGEVGVKARVRSVLNYKKPAFWIILLAIVICIAVAVCFLTDPVSKTPDPVETVDGNMKTYYKNEDGTWQVDGRVYRYRLEVTGRMNDAACDSTFVYLSNLESITFDQAWKAAGFSSNSTDYFAVEDAVLVELGPEADESVSQVGGADEPGAVKVEAEAIDKAINVVILKQNEGNKFPNGPIKVEAHTILGMEAKSGTPLLGQTNHMEETTVYIHYVYYRYARSDSELEQIAATATPAMLTFTGNRETGYTLKEYWEPNGGSTYEKDIRSKFPEDIADMVLDPRGGIIDTEALELECLTKAQTYLSDLPG